MKKLIFCMLFIILGKLSLTVGNTHPQGSAAWHNFNNNTLGAQLEYDRQRKQSVQQYQPQQPMETYIHWSVFVWNDETGKTFYLPCGAQAYNCQIMYELGDFGKK